MAAYFSPEVLELLNSTSDHGEVGEVAQLQPELPIGQIVCGDCREKLRTFPEASVQLILTDPPYFLDGLDGDWRKGGSDAPRATGTIGGLPVAMKFDPRQGIALQSFMEEVAEQWMRVLVPGGFALAFSQARLSHRMAIALENAGFEIRDMIVWHYRQRSQFKAFSQDHFVRKMPISEARKAALIKSLGGRRTPQLRPQYETIVLAQKPRDGTFINNWERWRTGLMDATASLDGTKPSNVMQVEKPTSKERGLDNDHLTPKPIKLLEHLIRLFSEPHQIVLDSFMGSGSTAVAAERSGRRWVGVELNPSYVDIGKKRVEAES